MSKDLTGNNNHRGTTSKVAKIFETNVEAV